MKRTLLFVLVTTVLLGTSTLYAVGDFNLMGLSAYHPNDYIDTCLLGPGQQVYTVFLFIYEPINPDFGSEGSRWVENISGFECRLWAEGEATILGWQFPVDAVDAGRNGNTVIGFGQPVPVRGQVTVLATLDILAGNPGGIFDDLTGELKTSPMCSDPTALLYIAPTRPTSSIEGTMAYVDADDPDDPLVSAYNYLVGVGNDLVMLIQTYPVATEDQSWGGIKALYR